MASGRVLGACKVASMVVDGSMVHWTCMGKVVQDTPYFPSTRTTPRTMVLEWQRVIPVHRTILGSVPSEGYR